MASTAQIAQFRDLSDESVVKRILDGDTALFEIIMRRHNQRLYRIARAVLRDDAEAEDVMQDAYVKAYEHLNQFEGRAKFSTWLSRIAFHEALARTRNKGRVQELEAIPENERDKMQSLRSPAMSPEEEASNSEVRCLLEEEINALPDNYRSVLVLRDVEEIDAAEVAEILSITLENVKMRLFRARAFLRKRLYLRAGAHSRYTFLFHAGRCDRVVITVFKKLGI
jgi:RNA polymerase sigma-70 factor (ECF subfamily)